MNCSEPIERLNHTINQAKDLSYLERTNKEEETINTFLDKVLILQKAYQKRNEEVNSITEKIEWLTWLELQPTEEVLKLVNLLLAVVRDWSTNLNKKYIEIPNPAVLNKVASNQYLSLQSSIEDLNELCDDVETLFFDSDHTRELKSISDLILSIQ